MPDDKRVEQGKRVIAACLLGGASATTAFKVAAEFVRALEGEQQTLTVIEHRCPVCFACGCRQHAEVA